jgi:hypothetical protein
VPAATPTGGTVTFTDTTNSAALGSCTLAAGTCNVTAAGTLFNLGANTVSASYGGVTGEFGPSSGTTPVTITGEADIVFSSVTHNFGGIAVGGTTTGAGNYGVELTNNSGAAYPFSISIVGSNFTQQNNCGSSVAIGKSCEIVFTFAPTATGPVSATWSVNADGLTFSPSNGGTLSGTGVSAAGVTLTTAAHNFGSLADGSTSPVYGAVLTNSTSAAVTLAVGSVSAPFVKVLNNCPATLVSGATCNLQFEFKPTAAGFVTQTFTLTANGGGTPITSGGSPVSGITLSGTGVAAGGVTLSTAKHNYGDVTVGTTSPVYGVVLTNGTSSAVTLALGSVVSPFATVVNNCPGSLPAAGTCNLQFVFSPTTTGQTSQEFTVTVNGGAVPVTSGGSTVTGVTLVGTGQ